VTYELLIHREARKELLELPGDVRNRVYQELLELKLDPRPRRVVKLKGREELWRLRVGRYRVIYEINDLERVVTILWVVLGNERTYRDL
jgi:mRNA interferase RelE/StbE